VEECEADLDRFRSWLGKITPGDYFGAPGTLAAREAIEAAALELAESGQAALSAEARPEDIPAAAAGGSGDRVAARG
jgi:hypothetical protein